MKPQGNSRGRIVSLKVHKDIYIDMEIRDQLIASTAVPGQFVMIRTLQEANEHLLLRPFDIAQIMPEKQTLRVLVKVKGTVTEGMRKLRAGDEITIRGPLGNGVREIPGNTMGVLVRGAGSAAVLALAEKAKSENKTVITFFSASTEDALIGVKYFENCSDVLHIATDDGSRGYRGDARDLLHDYLKEKRIDCLYTCGSRRFARTVKDLDAKKVTKGYLFLEEYMGCGVGTCHGCAVRKEKEDGYYLVCQDGPVFPASEVIIE